MSYKEVTGLVARAVEYKESDIILNVLTVEEGVLTVTVRGARRHGSPHAAAAQVLCYARMVLSEYRERYTLKEAEILETFPGLREELPAMALACYLAELALLFAPEGDALRLTVAALRALCKRNRPSALVKAAFELRLLYDAGLDPSEGLSERDRDAVLALSHIRGVPEGKVFSFTIGEESLARLYTLSERLILEQTERAPASLEYYWKLA